MLLFREEVLSLLHAVLLLRKQADRSHFGVRPARSLRALALSQLAVHFRKGSPPRPAGSRRPASGP